MPINKQLTINKPVTLTFGKEIIVNMIFDSQEKATYVTTKYNATDSLDRGTITIQGIDYDTLTGPGTTFTLNETDVWPVIDTIKSK